MDRLTPHPSSPESIRVFVNAHPVDANPGETILDAIARWDTALALTLREGQKALADSRGLKAPLTTRVYGGAIFRVISARE